MTADRFIIRHVQSINEHSKLFRSKQIRCICHDSEKPKNRIHKKACYNGNGNGNSANNDSDSNVSDYNEENLNNNGYGDSNEINQNKEEDTQNSIQLKNLLITIIILNAVIIHFLTILIILVTQKMMI